MDASCKIQGSIHVFRLVNNMCPGKWVHIRPDASFFNQKLINLIYYIIYNSAILITGVIDVS